MAPKSRTGRTATVEATSTGTAMPTSTPLSDNVSPRGRLHRHGRGRVGSTRKRNDEDGLRVEEPRDFAPSSIVATPLDATKTAAAGAVAAPGHTAPTSASCRRVSRAVGKWQRRGEGGTSGSPVQLSQPSFAQTSASSATLAPLPPPPFPTVVLPVWCRSTCAAAYLLSEDGLTNELVDFFHYTELTPQETAARARLLRYVEDGVGQLWNNNSRLAPLESAAPSAGKMAQVSLYGSYALGLSLPNSDIDLVLTFPEEEKREAELRRQRACEASKIENDDSAASGLMEVVRQRQQLHLKRLHELAEHLRHTHGPSLKVEVFDQCRVPRIHLRDTTENGVSCDINSSLTSDRVARIVSRQERWLKDSPLAAFLVRVTKAVMKQWGLNEVFAGGLASTALYCLVLRFLAQAEQLHRHTKVEEQNLSPPCYDEATQSTLSLRTPVCCSPLSSSPPTVSSALLGCVSATTSAAVHPVSVAASIPSYVPSWLRSSSSSSSSSRHIAAAFPAAPPLSRDEVTKEKATSGASAVSVDAYSLCHWRDEDDSNRSSSDFLSSGCGSGGDSDDAEVDALTREALTPSLCATTVSTTPTSRTSAGTPMSSCSSEKTSSAAPPTAAVMEACRPSEPGAPNSCLGIEATQSTRTTVSSDLPSAEELTRVAQSRYGASPARLLLKLWHSLSSDAFLFGYQVADVFGDDALWATSELEGFSGKPSALPGIASLELATYASCTSADLSAPSYRLPDLLALFRCSSTSLDNMLRFQRYPRRMAPTMLSTIFIDPRMPC